MSKEEVREKVSKVLEGLIPEEDIPDFIDQHNKAFVSIVEYFKEDFKDLLEGEEDKELTPKEIFANLIEQIDDKIMEVSSGSKHKLFMATFLASSIKERLVNNLAIILDAEKNEEA